ncbi:multidrug transporter, partial [Pseudomonas syringae pv. tagetis]
SGTRQRVPADQSQAGESRITSSYSAALGVSWYELDLFGRVRSLSAQALETWVSSEDARGRTEIRLVASVACGCLPWRGE